MSILEKLASASVVPVADSRQLGYVSYATERAAFDLHRVEQFKQGITPLVSCLMVTRGDRRTLSHALECYRRQLYANRELVVVTDLPRIDAVTEILLEYRRPGAEPGRSAQHFRRTGARRGADAVGR
jgi:hypothetical protein